MTIARNVLQERRASLHFRQFAASSAHAISGCVQDHEQDAQDASRRLLQRAEAALADVLARPLPAGLYLVATPIGNLADISLRALAVLARADLIAAEDTRHSRRSCSRISASAASSPPITSTTPSGNARGCSRGIRAGFSVALISDAGTPLISDPGYKLVREALEAGISGDERSRRLRRRSPR